MQLLSGIVSVAIMDSMLRVNLLTMSIVRIYVITAIQPGSGALCISITQQYLGCVPVVIMALSRVESR